jgi:hypothetical protein
MLAIMMPDSSFPCVFSCCNTALPGVSGSAAHAFIAVISAVVHAVSTVVVFVAESDLLASAGLKNCCA